MQLGSVVRLTYWKLLIFAIHSHLWAQHTPNTNTEERALHRRHEQRRKGKVRWTLQGSFNLDRFLFHSVYDSSPFNFEDLNSNISVEQKGKEIWNEKGKEQKRLELSEIYLQMKLVCRVFFISTFSFSWFHFVHFYLEFGVEITGRCTMNYYRTSSVQWFWLLNTWKLIALSSIIDKSKKRKAKVKRVGCLTWGSISAINPRSTFWLTPDGFDHFWLDLGVF